MSPISNMIAYHSKPGGGLDGHFKSEPTFFSADPFKAHIFAEHLADSDNDTKDYESGLLEAGITVFPVLLSMDNPATTSRKLLFKIGAEKGIRKDALPKFADNFEDSDTAERAIVFDWLKEHGYDGAILPKDLMPVCAGGDWDFQVSYVAFYPERQAVFKLHPDYEPDQSMNDQPDPQFSPPDH